MCGETTNDQTHGDMWMNMFLRDTRCNTLSHAVHVNQDVMCARKCSVLVCSVDTSRRLVDRYQL